jgi:hypothetical protein
MIPHHVLNDLGADDRVAVLSHRGGLRFVVHRVTDSADVIRADATRAGAEVLATHLRDKAVILELVAGRERDVGGEG